MLPPDWENLPPEEKSSYLRYSPGMLVAREVEELTNENNEPLSAMDQETSVTVTSQAAQAVTPLPGFVWSILLKGLFRLLHPRLVVILAILAGVTLPIWISINVGGMVKLVTLFFEWDVSVLLWLSSLSLL